MEQQYTKVDLEMIQGLQAKGFTCIELELLDTGNAMQATVEVIPGKSVEFQLDRIPINRSKIRDYFGEASPMARYVIDPKYLSR